MWGYIIAINPKKTEKQIVKSIKFIGLPFHDYINTYDV